MKNFNKANVNILQKMMHNEMSLFLFQCIEKKRSKDSNALL